MKKWVFGALLTAVGFYLAPFYFAEVIKTSIEDRDIETLNTYVQWDSIQQDVAEQIANLTDVRAQRASAPRTLGDMFEQVFAEGAQELVNGFKNAGIALAVETFVTPEWVVSASHGQMPDLGDQVSNGMMGPVWQYLTRDTLSNPKARAAFASRITSDANYDSFSLFVISIYYQLEPSGPPRRICRIGMQRDGWLFWRVTHIAFEDELRVLAARVNELRVAERQQEERRAAMLAAAERRKASAAQAFTDASTQLFNAAAQTTVGAGSNVVDHQSAESPAPSPAPDVPPENDGRQTGAR